MKLTKKQQAEIRKLYQVYWNSYINGDLETYSALLDEDFKFIGSTEAEPLLNKKDSIKFLEATAEQLRGKAEFRNRNIKVETVDDLILITELCDGYILIGLEWNFYSRFRLSSLLKKKKEEWKFIHQHVSMPDSKAQEGESFGLEQIRTENIQLRDAVKRRTIELENKNRELEIEAATERVRVQSMAMQHPHDLEKVNKELLHQLNKLEIAGLSGVSFYLIDPDEIVTVWDLSSPGNMNDPNSYSFRYDSKKFPVMGEYVGILKSTKEDYFVLDFPTEKLLQGIEELKEIDLNIYNNYKHAFESGALQHQWNPAARITDGILSIDLMMPPTDDTKTIVLKMAGAFNQAYQRFLDLQKAEAQAREAQIEAALERIRAKAMAMHHSDELSDVLSVLFAQFDILGIRPIHAQLSLIDLEKNKFTYRVTGKEGKRIMAEQVIDMGAMDIWKETAEKWKRSEPNTINSLYFPKDIFPQVWDLFKEIRSHIPEDARVSPEDFPDGMYVTEGNCMFGYMGFAHNRKATAEEEDIVIRFATEFGRLYQRFLDLQKAEAQAREAQIELGLERVRARAMAMQKSEELKELIGTVSTELTKLDVILDRCFISIFNPETNASTWWMASPETPSNPTDLTMKYHEMPPYLAYLRAWQERKLKWQYVLEGETKKDWDCFVFSNTDFSLLPDFVIANMRSVDKVFLNGSFNTFGCLTIATIKELSDEQFDILLRFAKVFDLTYTRFNDLQKAEAQTREAQIETALERVRSQSMGMQTSKDLSHVTTAMFEQLRKLGGELYATGIVFCDKHENHVEQWHSVPGAGMLSPFIVPVDLDRIHQYRYDQWKKGTDLFSVEIPQDFIAQHFDAMFKLPSVKAVLDDFASKNIPMPETPSWEIDYGASFKHGYILVSALQPFADADILPRFAKVFEQTYTRFLDLQKAEAQAREAEIQLALERVRAKSLAMHNTSELQDVVNIVAQQLHQINIDINGGVFITINDEVDEHLPIWASQGAADYVHKAVVPPLSEPFFKKLTDAIRYRKDFYFEQLSHEEKIRLFQHMFNYAPWSELPQEKKNELLSREGGLCRSVAISQHTSISITDHYGKKFSDEENEVLRRFGKVLEQTYTRFLDLQKAEAQAREAMIEAALERVRSRSMAMHKSDEMLSVIEVVSEQLQHLNLNFDTVSFGKNNQEGDFKFWITSSGQPKPVLMQVPPLDSVVQNRVKDAKQKGISFFTDVLTADENREWSQHLIDNSEFKLFPEKVKDFSLKSPGFARSSFLLKNIDFYVGNYRAIPFTEEENAIFRRFAQVFEQAYTRFLDLQKAEAQTREAQIEVAVERVRAKALAMHKSDEILGVVFSMRNELDSLNIPGVLSTTITLRQDDGTIRLWDNTSAKQHEDGVWESSDFVFRLEENHPDFYLNRVWNSNEKYFVVEQEENDFPITIDWVRKFDNAMADVIENYFKDNRIKHYWHPGVQLEHGRLNLDCEIAPEPEMETILLKMAAAFDLAYKRFLDLQKAEARTREAQIETSLERIRSRTMGMQKSGELGDVAALLFKELNRLVDNLWTCGFVLCEKDRAEDQWWLSDENGFIPAFYVPNIGDVAHANIYNAWLNGATYHTEQLEGAVLQEHYDWLMSLPVARKIFDEMLAAGFKLPTWQKLHCAFFKTGYLVIITQVPCPEEEIFKRFAQVFDLTYTRFLDLQLKEEQSVKLIEEKQRLEKTLIDLQATQKQLIQSEKMASLGELTAGIAHEIQNPLNFVNNFSEVSKELLDEMREAIEKGDTVDAKDLMHDVIQNLEKINHHGKRAGDIVKGMLQHSRISSGTKEPTDINALCDEYLRLSYHGLRAKDKSFNATIKTDFDNTIGNINIIPQDIGRVILNLITNAFYVVNEKKHQHPALDYEPTVTIKTTSIHSPSGSRSIQIKISDNGGGIPPQILDKIFQPFFTTKPTGQGTGLGLSLAFDIVTKGHGGEIKVNTKEGEGSEFIIQLRTN